MPQKRAALFPVEPAARKAAAKAQPAAAGEARQASRAGKRTVTAYIDEAAFKALKVIAVEEDVTMQELFAEGINAVFERRGKARIA
jgi:hypothetical protein